MKALLTRGAHRLRVLFAQLALYLPLLLLPGGTLIAVATWAYRRRSVSGQRSLLNGQRSFGGEERSFVSERR